VNYPAHFNLKLNTIYIYIVVLDCVHYFNTVELYSKNNKFTCNTIALGLDIFALKFRVSHQTVIRVSHNNRMTLPLHTYAVRYSHHMYKSSVN